MTYIIIGAFDGISFDDVFQKFNKDDKIIFVEPIPYYFKILKFNCSKLLENECYFENIAISDKNEKLKMAYLDIEKINNYALFYQGCSSIIDNNQPINRYLKDVNNNDLKIIDVNAITFDELCQKYNIDKVDYLQIDCEGYDQKIVSNIDLDKYKIEILKFETHYLDSDFIYNFSKKWNNYKYQIIEGDIIFNKL